MPSIMYGKSHLEGDASAMRSTNPHEAALMTGFVRVISCEFVDGLSVRVSFIPADIVFFDLASVITSQRPTDVAFPQQSNHKAFSCPDLTASLLGAWASMKARACRRR